MLKIPSCFLYWGLRRRVATHGLTYIGNAPNMMLRAIASHRGVRMPGFFGFMLLASCLLLPALVSLLFFV